MRTIYPKLITAVFIVLLTAMIFKFSDANSKPESAVQTNDTAQLH